MANIFYGMSDGDFGESVALSGDGCTVAFVDGPQGLANVYAYANGAWAPKGSPLDTNDLDENSSVIGISSNGQVVCIGVPDRSSIFSNGGYAIVYSWALTFWAVRDAFIPTAADQQLGASVSVDATGNRVAIGCPHDGGTPGQVKIYLWNGATYALDGLALVGDAAWDEFGRTVSLSADGMTLAVGKKNIVEGIDSGAGSVQVYARGETAWVPRGAPIVGNEGDDTGFIVALDATGTLLAVSSPQKSYPLYGSGIIQVYSWNGTTWVQVGDDIKGDDISGANHFGFGDDFCFSKSGDRVLVSSSFGDNAEDGYNVDVLEFVLKDGAWERGASLLYPGIAYGCPIACSHFGDVAAIGFPDGGDEDEGGIGEVRYISGGEFVPMWDAVRALDEPLAEGVVGNDSTALSISLIVLELPRLALILGAAGSTYSIDVAQAIKLTETNRFGWEKYLTDGVVAGDSGQDFLYKLATIIEQLVISSPMGMIGQLSAESIVAVLLAELGSFGVGAEAISSMTAEDLAGALGQFLSEGTENIGVSETSLGNVRVYFYGIDQLQASESADTSAILRSAIEEGVAFYLSFGLGGQTYTGWAMDTKSFAVSEYQGYPFNSMCYAHGTYFGANENGVYELAGSTDAGESISARLRLGVTDFNLPQRKIVDSVYLGFRSDGTMLLRTISDGNIEATYTLTRNEGALHRRRVHPMAKSLKSVYWQFELENVDGADFELSEIEFFPVVMKRTV